MKTARFLAAGIVCVAAGVLVPSAPSVSSAEAFNDNQVPVIDAAEEGDLHIFADESYAMSSAVEPSALISSDFSSFCADADSGKCAGQNDLGFIAHLPVCGSESVTDCIVSLTATDAKGAVSAARFGSHFPARSANSYPGKPSIGLPTGTTPTVWSIPGVPHAAGSDYALTVMLRGGTAHRSGATFQASITAVSLKTDADTSNDYQAPRWIVPGRGAGPAQDRGKFRCAVWGDAGSCLLSQAFPEGVRFTVRVRLAVEPSGWIHGRLDDPSVDFENVGTGVEMTVSAGAVRVPAVRVVRKHLDFPEQLQQRFGPNGPYGAGGSRRGDGQFLTDLTKRNAEYGIVSYSDQGFAQLNDVLGLVNDTAAYAPWVWSVRTLGGEEMRNASSCITRGNGVKGIVSTDATVYGDGPPALSADGKSLDYKVASPHFTRTGEVFRGSYHLALRRDVADCLYGFSLAAPTTSSGYVEVSAYTDSDHPDDGGLDVRLDKEGIVDVEAPTVEKVTQSEVVASLLSPVVVNPTDVLYSTRTTLSNQGEDTLVTTLDGSDGWIYFSAVGITFSSPGISVAMSEIPVRTVMCVRGNSFTKVTARSQSCPAGSAVAKVRYCAYISGKIGVSVGRSPRCPNGTRAATSIICIKGGDAKRLVGVSPACPRGYSAARPSYCVTGSSARVVTAVPPKCGNGYLKALLTTCRRGAKIQKVLAVKPRCPKGYSKSG